MIAAQPETVQVFPVLPALPAAISSLGTSAYLLQNSRLGLAAQVPICEPGFPFGNQQNALGLRADVRQTHVRSRCTGKERDWESGLDFSQARYYSAWQGRFGGVDPENAGADSGSPQTYHGYAYVTNSPLVNTDPDGMTVCDENGDHCHGEVVVNGGSNPFLDYLWFFLQAPGMRAAQNASDELGHVAQAVSGFRNSSNCTGTLVAAGRAIGAVGLGVPSALTGLGLGAAAGIEGGPLALATGAGGAALLGGAGATVGGWAGGGLGGVAAGVICSNGARGGSGAGRRGDYREKTKGANANDRKQINDAARQEGVDARELGRYVEKAKKLEGREASENFSFDELLELARELKSGAR